VTVSPTDPDAPNGGQWFAVEAEPGETVEVDALVTNPAETAQSVHLYLADLTLTEGADPAVGASDAGVAAWGQFAQSERMLDAKAVTRATFVITVPVDAEPGDHIGVVVAESGASGPAGGVGVIKRVAARLYVTVPGDADASVAIESIDTELDQVLRPREVRTTFLVHNTGKVRLEVEVTVNGRRADGPSTIVSQSAEVYTVTTAVGLFGGREAIDVRVATTTLSGAGPDAETARHVLVIPWWVLLALFLLVLGTVTVRELAKRLR
jgi:hypothetical protein